LSKIKNTLGFYKPIEAIDTCICMGASIGMANGIAKLHNGPVLAIIGVSTFFHTCIPGLVDAVYNQNDVLVIIVDNSATAMTGFQPHPGTGTKITGEPGSIRFNDNIKSSFFFNSYLLMPK